MFENRSFGSPDIEKQVENLREKLKTFKPTNTREVLEFNQEVYETLSAYKKKLSKEDYYVGMRRVADDYQKHLYSNNLVTEAREVETVDQELFHFINANHKAYSNVLENLYNQTSGEQLIAPEVFENTVKEIENITANKIPTLPENVQQMCKKATTWATSKNQNI